MTYNMHNNLLRFIVLLAFQFGKIAFALQQQVLNGVPVHRVLLRQNDPNSLYGLAVSASYWYDNNERNDHDDDEWQQQQQENRSPPTLPIINSANFLATQVWPCSRVACMALERIIIPQQLLLFKQQQQLQQKPQQHSIMTVCEFGCGPGLPSLMAAKLGLKVIATDVDDMALQLVQAAAQEQGFLTTTGSYIKTQFFDLTNYHQHDDSSLIAATAASSSIQLLPHADLYLMSDVFESNAVARGAAHVTMHILSMKKHQPKVWVFCQSDRVQRDMYWRELARMWDCNNNNNMLSSSSSTPPTWQNLDDLTLDQQLWLCNVDEMQVPYL